WAAPLRLAERAGGHARPNFGAHANISHELQVVKKSTPRFFIRLPRRVPCDRHKRGISRHTLDVTSLEPKSTRLPIVPIGRKLPIQRTNRSPPRQSSRQKSAWPLQSKASCQKAGTSLSPAVKRADGK